jgi:hypothetical protein
MAYPRMSIKARPGKGSKLPVLLMVLLAWALASARPVIQGS